MEVAENFAKRYYRLLDEVADLELLENFFSPNGFEILEAGLKIDSFEKYALWYAGVKERFLTKRHELKNIEVRTFKEGFVVDMLMSFHAQLHSGKEINIHNAHITWQLSKEPLKIKRYEIKF